MLVLGLCDRSDHVEYRVVVVNWLLTQRLVKVWTMRSSGMRPKSRCHIFLLMAFRQIGQTLIASFEGFTPSTDIRMLLERYAIGNILLTTQNIQGTAEKLDYSLNSLAD